MNRTISLAMLAVLSLAPCSCATSGGAGETSRIKVQIHGPDIQDRLEAQIQLDGQFIGSTNQTSMFLELAPGMHTIAAEAAGHLPERLTIEVLERKTSALPGGNAEGGFQQLIDIRFRKAADGK